MLARDYIVAHLPDVLNLLLVLQETASPYEPLANRAGGTRADSGYLELDITDGRHWGYLHFEGMRIRRELNSQRGGRHNRKKIDRAVKLALAE